MPNITSITEKHFEDLLDNLNDIKAVKTVYWDYLVRLFSIEWGGMYWYNAEEKNWLKGDGFSPDALKKLPNSVPEQNKALNLLRTSGILGLKENCDLPEESIIEKEDLPENLTASILILFGTEFHAPAFIVLGAKANDERFSLEEILCLHRLTRFFFHAYEKIELTSQLLSADKNLTVSAVAAGIAHEIGNNITPIIGRIQLLQRLIDKITDPELVEKIGTHANIIYGQSCKIARIARNLSKLSQPLELEIQELNLEEEMKAAVEIMSETAGKIKHFKTEDPHSQYVLITSYEPNLPLIRGDSQQLQQVFINLIINAAHAVEEKGRGTLSVGTRQSQNDTVIAYVYDSGIGMTPETLKKMWEPFFTTKKSGKGTGLGMAIVKKVMEAHGARIEVKSILGEGTKFDLIFPALKRE